jgi:hypothetical protein
MRRPHPPTRASPGGRHRIQAHTQHPACASARFSKSPARECGPQRRATCARHACVAHAHAVQQLGRASTRRTAIPLARQPLPTVPSHRAWPLGGAPPPRPPPGVPHGAAGGMPGRTRLPREASGCWRGLRRRVGRRSQSGSVFMGSSCCPGGGGRGGGRFDLICNAQRRVSARPPMRPLHPGTKGGGKGPVGLAILPLSAACTTPSLPLPGVPVHRSHRHRKRAIPNTRPTTTPSPPRTTAPPHATAGLAPHLAEDHAGGPATMRARNEPSRCLPKPRSTCSVRTALERASVRPITTHPGAATSRQQRGQAQGTT